MMNQEVIKNEEIMEGVAIEDVVDTVDNKGGKILTLLAVGGITILVGLGIAKLVKKAAATKCENEQLDGARNLKSNTMTPDDVNSI